MVMGASPFAVRDGDGGGGEEGGGGVREVFLKILGARPHWPKEEKPASRRQQSSRAAAAEQPPMPPPSAKKLSPVFKAFVNALLVKVRRAKALSLEPHAAAAARHSRRCHGRCRPPHLSDMLPALAHFR